MAQAIRMQVLNEIVRILQEEISWEPDPSNRKTINALQTNAIVFRKVGVLDRDISPGKVTEQLPGIFVSLPFTEGFPEDAGTNEQDEYRYRFLIQIIDNDNYAKTLNMETYTLWQERIMSRGSLATKGGLQWRNLTESGNVHATRALCTCTGVQTVDPAYWEKRQGFKTGVELLVRTWLTYAGG